MLEFCKKRNKFGFFERFKGGKWKNTNCVPISILLWMKNGKFNSLHHHCFCVKIYPQSFWGWFFQIYSPSTTTGSIHIIFKPLRSHYSNQIANGPHPFVYDRSALGVRIEKIVLHAFHFIIKVHYIRFM